MWQIDKELFPKLEKACGNKFVAINFISKSARRLFNETYGWVIEAKLIDWVITGTKPDLDYSDKLHKQTNRELAEIEDFLSYIEDDNIVSSVKISYIMSVRNHNLSYRYKNILSDEERARVRVLTRMCWYELSV